VSSAFEAGIVESAIGVEVSPGLNLTTMWRLIDMTRVLRHVVAASASRRSLDIS
jgi:hypothetical protein